MLGIANTIGIQNKKQTVSEYYLVCAKIDEISMKSSYRELILLEVISSCTDYGNKYI